MTFPTSDMGRTQQQGGQPSPYSFGTTVDAPFEVAMARVIEALKTEGFEILSTIDVQKVMREKLNVDFERYTILGACNADLAHRALLIEHLAGLAMPCAVVVHKTHDAVDAQGTRIEFADPVAMLSMMDQLANLDLGRQAQEMLQRVSARLSAAPQQATTHN